MEKQKKEASVSILNYLQNHDNEIVSNFIVFGCHQCFFVIETLTLFHKLIFIGSPIDIKQ
jgi:hypothetical protein